MTREPRKNLIQRAARLAAALARLYPEARISLDFKNPWQCLVATILSAQCTDKRVNQVTPRLFAELPDLRAMDAAPAARIEHLILDTGFFRQKTRSLKGAAHAILERFGGEIPSRMEDLLTLPGVGRKTANVLLGHVFRPARSGGRYPRASGGKAFGAHARDGPQKNRARFASAAPTHRMDGVLYASNPSWAYRVHGAPTAMRGLPACGRLPAHWSGGRVAGKHRSEKIQGWREEEPCLTSRGDMQ
jgi:endonuclease-3